MRVRADFLNAFNRPHFQGPQTNVSNNDFGTITSAPLKNWWATKSPRLAEKPVGRLKVSSGGTYLTLCDGTSLTLTGVLLAIGSGRDSGIERTNFLAAAGHQRFLAPQAIRGMRKGDFSGAF